MKKIMETEENYKNAIEILNSLQSNTTNVAMAGQNLGAKREMKLYQTVGALETIGVSLDTVDNLNIVHVAGTKGKGMTCAFTESILRNAGLNTGFFSSPHLTSARERIRVNGKPLSENSFAKHFFAVYHRMKKLQEPNAPYEMPGYFRFLTCMAIQVFIEEEVEVAIMEVGIGGKNDSTNIIRKPVVCGITSLGLEHQHVLGNTLEEIALHKAGIMKKCVSTYTVSSHPPHIQELLRNHAKFTECSIHFVQPLNLSNTNNMRLGVDDGAVARLNAALAIHLANEFLLQKYPHLFPYLPLNAKSAAEIKYCETEHLLAFHIKGLQFTKWDGRFQVLKASDQVTYYLDGAHTLDSLEVARNWFKKVAPESSFRILVFNLTGKRLCLPLLTSFAHNKLFNLAVFCPFIGSETKKIPDNWSVREEGIDQIEICRGYAEVWESLQTSSKGIVCPSAEETIKQISKIVVESSMNGNVQNRVSVLVTGSLHLVGTFLSVLDPTSND